MHNADVLEFTGATRQLRSLTVEVSGLREAAAVAVYATRTPKGYRPLPATDAGYEGVACVDDAARAAVLYLDAFATKGIGWAREEATRLVRFVEHMQLEDGSFANFILDWRGTKNLVGETSRSMVDGFWTRRGLHALACAWRGLQSPSARDHFLAGWSWIVGDCPFMDQRGLDVITALTAYEASGDAVYLDHALAWADAILGAADGETIHCMRGGDATKDRLWGRYQEAALALVGNALDKPYLVEAAEASARAVYGPVVETRFARKTTIPYDVSSVALAAHCLYRATHRPEWQRMRDQARAWFHWRNPVASPLFDPVIGAFFDGVDGDRINTNSGGEANIEACNAIFGFRDLVSVA